MKTRPLGAELFHEDGRIDTHEETNSNLANSHFLLKKATKKVRKAKPFWRVRVIEAILATIVTATGYVTNKHNHSHHINMVTY
jgi:hypothetical protein